MDIKKSNWMFVWIFFVQTLFLLSGCSIFQGTKGTETSNIRVAYAHIIGQPSTAAFGQIEVNYQVDHLCAGRPLSNNCVHLLFAKATMPKEGLATKAILVFHWKSYFHTYAEIEREYGEPEDGHDSYYAFQNDARKGILLDTPANRATVSQWSLNYLSHTPPGQEITKVKAIEIATNMLRAETKVADEIYKFTAKRYAYGWHLGCTMVKADGSQQVGHFCAILVGDDGEIKQVFGGM